MNMPTKLELQERVAELEGELEEVYNQLGDLLDVEQEDDDSEE
jgi:hypothetical protein